MLKLLWLCVFTICMKFVVSENSGFGGNPIQSGSGMNFYTEIPNTSVLRRPQILNFEPSTCSEMCSNSFFDDQDICCEDSEPLQCNYSYPYRKYSGSCNNPYIPSLGKSEICYLRLTPAYYKGKGESRKSVTGDPLPEPRDISQYILNDVHHPSEKVTYLFTAYGQIIAHDLSRAMQPQMNCCKSENAKKEECKITISVRPDDPFYSQFHQTCLSFQRSEPCTHCKTVHRAQKNFATSILDANIVYGTSKKQAKKLRTNDGTGKLKSSSRSKGYLLPAGKDKGDNFCPKGQNSNCFLSGDPRVNMHTSLTTLQTIYMREHNKYAKSLKKTNPHWGEEKLFQEARKILIAVYQCIIYKEYLPILLGSRIVDLFDLTVRSGASGTTYYPEVVLAEFQEHASAAFRPHSMVPTNIGLLNYTFKDTNANPRMIHERCILNITAGSYQVPSEDYDRWIVKDLSDFFNRKSGVPYGVDLSAIDIQRGRDHGLAPYIEVVKFCSGGTIVISSFGDLYRLSLMPRKNIMLFEDMYNDVKDVDVLVGMLLEYHYPGSQLGPSATCVNVIQFYSLQKGDRFYFDHEGVFTEDQRKAIKQTSIARILCDNTEITHITRNTFLLPSDKNPERSCKEIPIMDLTPWKESTFEEDIPTDCVL